MIDIGFWELGLVFLVALLIIGPKRLPKIAHMIGQHLTKLKRTWQHLQHQVDDTLDDNSKPDDTKSTRDK